MEVYVCEGIDDVFIDGNLMEYKEVTSDENGKTITIGKYTTEVVAGNHTIFYSLTNGHSGTATMYVNGEKVSGYTFTAEGKYTENSYGIKIQGIEKSGYVPESPDAPAPVEEKDEGMALTDILLIVFVILAAILVVVVAIRMMRS